MLLLVGDGEMHDSIENKIAALGKQDSVVMVDKVANPEVYYKAVNVVICPLLSQGFLMVAVEAQVSGVPVLASIAVSKEVSVSDGCEFLEFSSPIKAWAEDVLLCVEGRWHR